MGCKGLHCDGCNHGGGPAAAVIALLVIVALGLRAAWPKAVHVVEIAAWTVAGVTGAAIAITGTVLAVRAVRRVRARRELRQAARQVHAAYTATVIPAVRLTDPSAIDRAGWPVLGQPPRRQPGAWPLAGWREDERPWTGGDSDEHRPANPSAASRAAHSRHAVSRPGSPSKEAPSMTTTTTADTTRADAATILRAVADLIQTRPDIPVPGTDIRFYVRGDGAPALMAAIAAALPCQWRAEFSRSGEYEWLYLRSGPASAVRGTRVDISAPAADACTAAGARTVTVWQPAAALTGFVGSDALGEVA